MAYDIDDLPHKLRTRIDINADTGCWEVALIKPRSDTPSPYRSIPYRGKLWQTHVLAYRLLAGRYDPQLTLDHVYERGCRSKACCNPAHLEPVTSGENTRRRLAAMVTRDG